MVRVRVRVQRGLFIPLNLILEERKLFQMFTKVTDDKLETRDTNAMSSSSGPKDPWNVVKLIMFVQGIGRLFPWNVFITASSYFGQRFCNTPYAGDFENYFNVGFAVTGVIGLLISILYGNNLSFHAKIVSPLILYASLFVLMTVLVLFPEIKSLTLFWVTLFAVFCCGLTGSFLSAGFFSLNSLLPSVYMGSYMSGQAFSGLTVSLTSLISQAVRPLPTQFCAVAEDDVVNACPDYHVDYSAFAYFLVAAALLCICLALYFVMMRLPFTIDYVRGFERDAGEAAGAAEPLLDANVKFEGDFDDFEPQDSAERSQPHAVSNTQSSYQSILAIFRVIKNPAWAVFTLYAVSLALTPALLITVVSTNRCQEGSSRFQNDLFVPLLFVLSAIGDFVARMIAGNTQRTILTPDNVLWLALARVILFPLCLMTNISNSRMPIVFVSDAFPMIFMTLLAFTNGYLVSCCMMMGPTLVATKDAPMASKIMAFMLTLGLLVGSMLSFLMTYVSQGQA